MSIDGYTLCNVTSVNVKDTIELLSNIFNYNEIIPPYRKLRELIEDELVNSLDNLTQKYKLCKYYVLKDNEQIIGVTGLYREKEDNDDTIWIGWFGIRSSHRGKKLGEKLLTWTIDSAKQIPELRHIRFIY
jgi:RimJ/RimL family protein N-acetyltransferase